MRRWVAAIGRTRVGAFMRVAAARWAAMRALGQRAPDGIAVAALYRRMLRAAWREPVELADLALDGGDLIEAQIAQGPAVGRTLAALLDLVLEDPARNEHARLLAEARRIAGGA